MVRNDGGSVENVEVWGRRRFAYEIDKKAEGIYAVVTLNESIMRTKVIRTDAH